MDYTTLLERYEGMELYFTNVPCEYIINIASEVGKAMNIEVNGQLIEDMCERKCRRGKERICCFSDSKDYKRYIFLDCSISDLLYKIVVRCVKEEGEKVKDALYKWESLAREEYKQPIPKERSPLFYTDKINCENGSNPIYIGLRKNDLI